MSDMEKDIERLNREIKNVKKQADEAAGAIKVLKKRLKDEFNLIYNDDPDKCEVEAELDRLDNEIKNLQEKQEQAYNDLKKNHEW